MEVLIKGGKIYFNDDNVIHIECGLAFILSNGFKAWYLNGIKYTEDEYKIKMRTKKLKEIL